MIEALIVSAGEPQVHKCVESVRTQTLPFSKIVHVDGVVPQAKAFEEGLAQVSADWVLLVNGDMVLKITANQTAWSKIRKYQGRNVGQFHYALWDPFVQRTVNACCAFYVPALRSVPRRDRLNNDVHIMYAMGRIGFPTKRYYKGKNKIIIGTHFEDPDAFQIFRRFFVRGIKKSWRDKRLIEELILNTRKEEYGLALEAYEFGEKKRAYPGSHDIEYDKKMFEEFRESLDRNLRPE